MMVRCADGHERDVDEGSLCPNAFARDEHDPCLGRVERIMPGSCYCGATRAPCGHCESVFLGCRACGWRMDGDDES